MPNAQVSTTVELSPVAISGNASDLTNGTTGTGEVVLADAPTITSPEISGTATLGTYWRLESDLGGQNPSCLYFDNSSTFTPRGAALSVASTQTTTPGGVQASIFSVATGNNGNGSEFVGISNGYLQSGDQHTASFTGSISGTTLTASGVTGTISVGNGVVGAGVAAGTWIVSGSGSHWTVNQSQSVSSIAMTAYTKGVLYGLQVSVAPNSTRNNVPFDDVDCLVLQNESPNGSKGTDCVYIGIGPNFSAGAHEFITGYNIDASADYAFKANGSYYYVFDAASSTPAFAVLHGPNSVPLITALNGAGSGDITVVEVNNTDHVVIGSSITCNPSNGTSIFNSTLYPVSDNAADIGAPDQRFGTVFSETWSSNNGSHEWTFTGTTSTDTNFILGHDANPYLTLGTSGGLTLNAYGAGTLQTNASGVVTASSDARMKTIKGEFSRGIEEICALDPILYS